MFNRTNRIRIVMCTFCQLFYNIFNVLFAWIIMRITDSLVEEDRSIFVSYIGIAGACIGCQILFNFLSVRLQNKIISVSMSMVRTKSLCGIMKREGRCLTESEKSKYIAYFTNELELFENSYLRVWLNMLNSVMLLILSGGMIFKIHRIMLLIIIVMLILIVLIPFGLSSGLQKSNAVFLGSNKEMIEKTDEFLRGFEVIKSFFVEKKIVFLYEKVVKKCTNDKKQLEDKMGISNVITSIMSIITMLLIFVIGGYLILKSVMTVGALLAVIQLISNMIAPLTDIVYGINEINSVKEVKEKVILLLKKADEYQQEISLESIGNRIEIKNLAFSYQNQEEAVLKKVDLELEKGKTYVVVGENGSGKSTFAKIVSGYYMDYTGDIKIDGKDIREIPKDMLRNRIVYMNQRDFLFDASPKENCTLFGKYKIDSTFVKEMDCSELLEKKYSTTIMSGGERQKIAFIRSFSKEADVLICDEAESAMDILGKKYFIKALKKDKERIKVIITHTIDESLKEYDEILYFKDGILAEKGSGDKLFADKGAFYDFYKRQVI